MKGIAMFILVFAISCIVEEISPSKDDMSPPLPTLVFMLGLVYFLYWFIS